MRADEPAPVALPLSLLAVMSISLLIALVPIHGAGTQKQQSIISSRYPEKIYLQFRDERFSTTSASLLSRASVRNPESLFQRLVTPFKSSDRDSRRFDESRVTAWVSSIADRVATAAVKPRVILNEQPPTLQIYSGKMGLQVDVDATVENIISGNFVATDTATLMIEETGIELSPDALIESERRAQAFSTKSLRLIGPTTTTTLRKASLLSLLALPAGIDEDALKTLLESQQMIVARPPIEPVLTLSGKEVVEFVAPKPGISINELAFLESVREAFRILDSGSASASLSIPTKETPPLQSLADVNTVGIVDRLGFGESAYAHSIPNRVHNVAHTAEKMHGILLFPGEEFSFVKHLGEVSKRTGFKEAYIIKDGQTVLGDGGGVCQVSSTIFRAVLNAGLPITARKGHSYRVGYYEQNSKPGFDATVYAPSPDFRFVNDTEAPVLLSVLADSSAKTMRVELWGASDGRTAEIRNYRQWDSVAAPPPLYQVDGSLRPGQVRQIEYAAPGLKTSFEYVVRLRNGEERVETYKTNYIPWRAVYLRGP